MQVFVPESRQCPNWQLKQEEVICIIDGGLYQTNFSIILTGLAMERPKSQQSQLIKVFCRFLPRNKGENADTVKFSDKDVTLSHQARSQVPRSRWSKGEITFEEQKQEEEKIEFERVYGPSSTQEQVYSSFAQPLIPDLFNGFRCCLMAYGQIGSGKSHTLIGDITEDIITTASGILPRILCDIYKEAEKRGIPYKINGFGVQIYNDIIFDLNVESPKHVKPKLDHKKGVLSGRAAPKKFTCKSSREMLKEFVRISKNRAVSATQANSKSSRSHGIFAVTIYAKQTFLGQLYLVDLAGSEEASGNSQTAAEGRKINQSLTFLQQVILCLGTQGSVPNFRNCVLTLVLQPCFQFKSRCHMMFTAALSEDKKLETYKTIRFSKDSARAQVVEKLDCQDEDKIDPLARKVFCESFPAFLELLDKYHSKQLNRIMISEASNEELLQKNTDLLKEIKKLKREATTMRNEVNTLMNEKESLKRQVERLKVLAEK